MGFSVLLEAAIKAGVKFSLNGDKMAWQAPIGSSSYAEALRPYKAKLLEFLRQRDRVLGMNLKQFSEGFWAVRAWSEHLQKEIWLVSNPEAAKLNRIPKGAITLTGAELAELVRLSPGPRELQVIIQAKEKLGARLVPGGLTLKRKPSHGRLNQADSRNPVRGPEARPYGR